MLASSFLSPLPQCQPRHLPWRCREEGTREHGPDQAVEGRAEPRGPPNSLLLSSGNSAATSRPGGFGARHQFACASILSLQPRWKPRPRPQLGGGRGAGRAARGVLARAPAPGQPQPIAGRSRRPLRWGGPASVPVPAPSAASPNPLDPRRRGRWETLSRGRCVRARGCSCVFRGCVCAGALRGSACPVSTNRWVWGCTSRRGEEVSAGFEAPGGRGSPGSAPAPGALPTPTRGEGRLPTAPGCSRAVFLVQTR